MKYDVIGLMSGTSLDGTDLVFCSLHVIRGEWRYKIRHAETIPYPDSWKNRLRLLPNGSAFDFALTDTDYGHYLGRLIRDFIERHKIRPDFIASHGHTIFHDPALRLTSQIGNGAAIAAETGLPVINDFRSLDVALGGQGAPLVPIGDRLLFGDYDFCLNLGGFSNISFEKNNTRCAFDICPLNVVLNQLAELLGHPYDEEGHFARLGKVDPGFLDALNRLPYYAKFPPKSLGIEWVREQIYPLIHNYFPSIPLENDQRPHQPLQRETAAAIHDCLATWCEHAAIQISRATALIETDSPRNPSFSGESASQQPDKPLRDKLLLATGGGSFNQYLMERIAHYLRCKIIIPDHNTVNYKEALIFALLGTLRWRGEVNALKSVTGASHDAPGGAIFNLTTR